MMNCSTYKHSNKVQEIVALVMNKTRCNPRVNGSNYILLCPAHRDTTASLSISEGRDGQAMVHCFVGCTYLDICGALGIKPQDLYPKDPKRPVQNKTKFIKVFNKFPRVGAV